MAVINFRSSEAVSAAWRQRQLYAGEKRGVFFFLDNSLGAWTPAVCVRVCARAHSDALL